MIKGLAHLAFAANDLKKTLAFYAQLGLREAFRLNNADGSLMLVYLHVEGDQFIEIFPNGPSLDPARRSSFMHVCLRVDDLQETITQLRNRGVIIRKEPSLGLDRNWQAWIKDPDGNDIELMQLDESSPQRKTARGETVSF
jgi:lactoylglutathione lyase